MALGASVLFALAICLWVTWWALNWQARSGTEEPNAADWLQGWGTIFGLVVTTIGAVVAGLVYYESVKAARVAEKRRLEDREEAQQAADTAEQRRLEDREEARRAAAAAEDRWRQERQDWAERTAELQDANRKAEQRAEEERRRFYEQQREAALRAPRAVLVTRVGPSMAGAGLVNQLFLGVQNFGDGPIRKVVCKVDYLPDSLVFTMGVPVVAPGTTERPVWNSPSAAPERISAREAPVWDLDVPSASWRVRLFFIDAAGLAWMREDNYAPTEIEYDDIPVVSQKVERSSPESQ